MAKLDLSFSFLGQDRSGRQLNIQDNTGLLANGIEEGYTTGMLESLKQYIFSISKYENSFKDFFVFDGLLDYLPTPIEFAGGSPIILSTGLFNNTDVHEIFTDGVYDLNIYVDFNKIDTEVEILEGRNFILKNNEDKNFEGIEDFDAILINGKVYDIDTSKDRIDDRVIWLINEIETDATSISFLYRYNTKIFLTATAEYLHSYAVKELKNDLSNYSWEVVNTALSLMISSNLWYDADDYAEANEEINAANTLLKQFIC